MIAWLTTRRQWGADETVRQYYVYMMSIEQTNDIRSALAREKQIKGWIRAKKVSLIESVNPHWLDLSADWA